MSSCYFECPPGTTSRMLWCMQNLARVQRPTFEQMEDVFENDGQLFLACADNGSWQAVVILMTRYDLQRVGPTPDDLRPVTYFVADLATIQQYSPGFKHFWQGHIAEQHE